MKKIRMQGAVTNMARQGLKTDQIALPMFLFISCFGDEKISVRHKL